MNCKDCFQDCQRIGCDIELECSGYVEPSNGTKERMDERLKMMHKLYPDAKPTNADRIRSMTDEELAEMLNHAQGDGFLVGIGQRKMSAYGNWLEWLKRESEGK